MSLVKRFFTTGKEKYQFGPRDAVIRKGDEIISEKKDILAPLHWSDTAVNIVAHKYLRGRGEDAEYSIDQLLTRVTTTITQWGLDQGYFVEDEAEIFEQELYHILYHQYASFNSPVWFNVGWEKQAASSACFILNVDDSMESITDWIKTEAMIFKNGSGAGVNISKLRSKKEFLSGGGRPSGPLSFMKAADTSAGIIKSGGAVRRSAKILIMDVDHPDVMDFINCKISEEQKARVLLAAGYSDGMEGEAYSTVAFQSSNHSLALSDDFMDSVSTGKDWNLIERTTGGISETIAPEAIMEAMSKAIYDCGDPGVFFIDSSNRFNTVPHVARFESTNPCFTGDTLVDTVEGFIPIADLVEDFDAGVDLPQTLSFNEDTGLPTLGSITRAFQSGETSELVDVITDKGVVIRCTPNHRFLTRSIHGTPGKWVRADNLFPGTRLRKTGRWINDQRSNRRYINMRETERCPNGTQAYSLFLWELVHGRIPEGMELHHINEDPTDDRLSNLELRDMHDHQSEHQSGEGNGRFIIMSDDFLGDWWYQFKTERRGKKLTPATWYKFICSHDMKGRLPCANNREDGYWIQGMPWKDFVIRAEKAVDGNNDKVKCVRRVSLSEPIPVYDLEVEGFHNFSVSCPGHVHSLVVHNCCEFHFVNNSACNLASIRLTSCLCDNCQFDVKSFEQIVKVMVLAQDIMIDRSHYPTEEIARNSSELRPIGLGYSDLGAMLMISGLPYDSDEGRQAAAEITSLMTGLAYLQSSEIAKVKGSFKHLDLESMRKVLNIHTGYSFDLEDRGDEYQFIPYSDLKEVWSDVRSRTEFRNAQTTLLAPTGTISFFMDCATTGIEPEFSLIKHKSLAGGGNITTYSDCARRYAERMGEDLESALIKNPKNFQCALGADCLTPKAHIDMVAAVQPFLSGGVSKTINVPSTITPAEIRDLIVYAYEQGLKGVTFYRDGSKSGQPLSTTKQPEPVKPLPEEKPKLQRRKLPKNCEARRHKFEFDGIEGYIHAGLYPDGTLGELFVTVSKDGSTISGLMDTIAALTSISLQYGVPLKTLVQKFSHVRFEPAGFTGTPEVPFAKSLVDYMFRFIGMTYLQDGDKEDIGLVVPSIDDPAEQAHLPVIDTSICTHCGGLMTRTGTCWTCSVCSSSSGGCS